MHDQMVMPIGIYYLVGAVFNSSYSSRSSTSSTSTSTTFQTLEQKNNIKNASATTTKM